MDRITVVIRRDTGAKEITPELVEDALNYYLGMDVSVTVFYAAQQSVQADGLICTCETNDSSRPWFLHALDCPVNARR